MCVTLYFAISASRFPWRNRVGWNIELFSQAGLTMCEVVPRIFKHPEKDRVQSVLSDAAYRIGVQDLPTNQIKMSALQYVVRAKKM